jgi:hypothetical protein
MPKLKVFCATSGFHDSIVAAPSKPAALKAWGAKTDLFSMGAARLVTDPKIAKKALERPGEVIRLKRGGGQEEAPAPRKRRKPAKPPSRSKLKAAEQELARLDADQARERGAVERELRSLEKKLEGIVARHSKSRAAVEARVDQAREDYEAALAGWDA